MKNKKNILSIVIVNYKVREQILESIASIKNNLHKISYEIIIVDNEGDEILRNSLKSYKEVKYIKSGSNLGFGGGNNLGVSKSLGEYILFLNPDTIVKKNSINKLLNFIKSDNTIGMVSPLLLNSKDKPFSTQSKNELTPINALFSFSLLRKLFPNKNIYNDPFFKKWDYKKPIEVEAVPGAALMIEKNLFNKVGGFDEKFFLYFEENDLSKRVRNLGFKLFVVPQAEVVHKVGQSTGKVKERDKIFKKSRRYFFRKHYGLLLSIFLETLFSINKYSLLILFILSISFFLRIINLSISMPFIGDQGWFYMSAKNLLINGQFPLVGITSSHTWLHQGPLWTYILSLGLIVSNFNPLSGGFITSIFGVSSTYLMYRVGNAVFSKRTGIVAALLYAVSPLIIFFERMPFDPSIIPFFTICYFFCIYKWITGEKKYFPFILLLIAVLYNLELATFTLFLPFVAILFYGLIKKEQFALDVVNKQIIIKSLLLFLIPMIPIIIYDFYNGFKQTIVFLLWIIYKPFSFILNPSPLSNNNYVDVLTFLFNSLQKFLFNLNGAVSVIVLVFSVLILFKLILNKKDKLKNEFSLLFMFLSISILGILINKTPSDAYLPIIFPFLIFTVALSINYLLSFRRIKYVVAVLFTFMLLTNTYYAYINSFKPDYQNRINAVEKIIVLTKGQEYNLIGEGNGSQFESFTMNYEYLLWWKNNPASKDKEKLKIYVSEDEKGIHIR
jgi:GT2 family glycosyltransferase